MAWTEIGRRFGITECRVRQIHDAAMRKMRRELMNEPDIKRLFDEMDWEPDSPPANNPAH